MIGSCIVSGVAGAMIPLGLRKLGADPATASSIFLTTATDVTRAWACSSGSRRCLREGGGQILN
jgi:Mg/Co/Ni transporter MgtE